LGCFPLALSHILLTTTEPLHRADKGRNKKTKKLRKGKTLPAWVATTQSYSAGLTCQDAASPRNRRRGGHNTPGEKHFTSPIRGVSVCATSHRSRIKQSLPEVHTATRERTRKVEKGKCPEAVATSAGEWMRGKDNPVHGDVNPVESEFCHVLQSPQRISPVRLNCNQHSLLKQHNFGTSSTSVLIQRGWVPYKPFRSGQRSHAGQQHTHPPPIIQIPPYKQGLGGVCA